MSDYISKPTNAIANLTGAGGVGTINTKSDSAQAAVRVVVSDINARQVLLTNPNNQQSVSIPRGAFNSVAGLNVGQSYALIQQGNTQSTTRNALTSRASQSVSYILSPLTGASRPVAGSQLNPTANTPSTASSGNVAVPASLSGLSLPLSSTQVNSLVTALQNGGVQNADNIKAPSQSAINLRATISAIAGNQVTLQLPSGLTTTNQRIVVNLPTQIVAQLQNSQALNISVQIKNDRAVLLGIGLPSDGKLPQRNNSQLQQALAQLPSSLLNKTVLPYTADQILTLSKLSAGKNTLLQNANPVNNTNNAKPNNDIDISKQALNTLNNKPFVINKTLLEALPVSLSKQIVSQVFVNAKVPTSGAEVLATITKQNNGFALNVQGSLNTVQLNNKQVSLLLPATISSSSGQTQVYNSVTGNNQSNEIYQQSKTELTYAANGRINTADKKQASNTAVNQPSTSNSSVVKNTADKILTDNGANNPSASVSNNQNKPLFVPSRQLINDALLAVTNNPSLLQTKNANPGLSPSNRLDNLSQLQQVIGQLGKQSLPFTSAQTQIFNDILIALTDQQTWSGELQGVLNKIKDGLPKVDNQPALNDANTIKQLLSAQLNPSPVTNINALSQSGFLSGLVTLLQVSLASRLQKQSNQLATKDQQSIPDLVKKLIPNVTASQSSRFAQDFNQFDAKHSLSSEVAKLLANHQQHKLKSADLTIQNQDSLFYSLPNLFNKSGKDMEIFIKRDQSEPENQNNEQERQLKWQLNMKFSIADKGEMLAKTTLQENQIDLQIYTSNESLRDLVVEKLPYLGERLKQLGIDLVNRNCQLGKIPETLDKAHYQVFETNA